LTYCRSTVTRRASLGFQWVRVARSLVFCVVEITVLLSFFFWPLHCLFFNLRVFWLPLWYLQTFITTHRLVCFVFMKRKFTNK